ncbi:AimR family lysis-lysogeny pheromone receptor [Shouchella clausii]|uniref:AimR family lysis-lysogeny pheromone receptor n=1 Tax=Shouchella clausii TaxID=79880 RepID=UPI000BA67274|nr:AimR family lysis-lysogeny pheromone receptor [Shouchella clausii]PAD91661.1 hypothetical protein CHH52_13645 [Shouchella clausii]
MEKLADEIRALITKRGMTQTDLAEGSGTSKRLVSDFFSGKSDPKFLGVLNIVRFLFPDSEDEKMEQYCREVHKKNAVISAMEYASRTCKDELLSELIDKFAGVSTIKEAARVYELDLLNKQGEHQKAIDGCRLLLGQTNSSVLRLKVELIESKAFYDMGEKLVMLKTVNRMEEKLEELGEGYLKESYKLTYYSVAARAHLYARGDNDTAIIYALRAIKAKSTISPIQTAEMYHLIGQAHLTSCVDTSLEYLNKAVEIYEAQGNVEWANVIKNNDIPFIRNINNEVFDFEECYDKGEWAHQLLIRGQKEEAKEVLSSLPQLNPFEVMYMGEACGDVMLLIKAHSEITKTGNAFFSKIIESKINKLVKGITF